MKEIKNILISRDGLTAQEATAAILEFQRWLFEVMELPGYTLCDIEEEFQARFQLEPDYLEEILFNLC
jgi:hypothetical protein